MDIERKSEKKGFGKKFKHRHNNGNRRIHRTLKKRARRYADKVLRDE